jgi:hypothetical protein
MPISQNPQSADHIAGQAGTFEPQRQNNWSLEINIGTAADKDLVVMGLRAFALPNESNEDIEIPYQNEVRHIAGRYALDASTLVVNDFVDQDTRGALMRWRAQVYDSHTGKVGLAKNYKKTANVVMTAPDGSSRRVCKLIGCFPLSITGGNLSMESADPVQIEASIRYDKVDWSASLPGT